MINKKGTFFLVIILICTLNATSSAFAEIDSDLMTSVDNSINDAFETILRAEKEGAEVKELIDKLNSVNILYQEIINELEKENLIEANTKARQCIQITSELEQEAQLLETSAAEQTRILTQKYTIARRTGSILIFVIGFVLWAPFENYYKKRALKMRPVVNEDEP